MAHRLVYSLRPWYAEGLPKGRFMNKNLQKAINLLYTLQREAERDMDETMLIVEEELNIADKRNNAANAFKP